MNLIICKSIHHGSTKRLADRMANVLDAEVIEPKDFKNANYDLIGLGSGIYDHKHHQSILDVADKFPEKQKVFIFSTSGIVIKSQHDKLKEILKKNNCEFKGEFFCRGFNTNSFLKYFGGMNKGRPNEDDLKKAEDFVKKLI